MSRPTRSEQRLNPASVRPHVKICQEPELNVRSPRANSSPTTARSFSYTRPISPGPLPRDRVNAVSRSSSSLTRRRRAQRTRRRSRTRCTTSIPLRKAEISEKTTAATSRAAMLVFADVGHVLVEKNSGSSGLFCHRDPILNPWHRN